MIRLKKRRSKNKFVLIVFIILFGISCSIYLIKEFSKKANPLFLSYAESNVKQLSSLIVSKSVFKIIEKDVNLDKLFDVSKDNNNDIKLIDFNSEIASKLLTDTANIVLLNLKALEKGDIDYLNLPSDYDINKLKKGIICEIPFGVIYNSAFLSNIGPKIPVRFNLIGSVSTNIETNLKSYGINNALLEVYVKITTRTRISLPFVSENYELITRIPVAIKLIQGNIPSYYLNGYNNASNEIVKSFIE